MGGRADAGVGGGRAEPATTDGRGRRRGVAGRDESEGEGEGEGETAQRAEPLPQQSEPAARCAVATRRGAGGRCAPIFVRVSVQGRVARRQRRNVSPTTIDVQLMCRRRVIIFSRVAEERGDDSADTTHQRRIAQHPPPAARPRAFERGRAPLSAGSFTIHAAALSVVCRYLTPRAPAPRMHGPSPTPRSNQTSSSSRDAIPPFIRQAPSRSLLQSSAVCLCAHQTCRNGSRPVPVTDGWASARKPRG